MEPEEFSFERSNLFTRTLVGEDCYILPSKVKVIEEDIPNSYPQVLKDLGFKVIAQSGGWYNKVEMPDGWKLKTISSIATAIYDEKKRQRGVIIVYQNKNDIVAEVRLFSRFYLNFIEQRFYCNCRIIAQNTLLLIDKQLYESKKNMGVFEEYVNKFECIKTVKKELSMKYPGWDNPANWDGNSLIELIM